jgi:hypothetical protein
LLRRNIPSLTLWPTRKKGRKEQKGGERRGEEGREGKKTFSKEITMRLKKAAVR